MQSFPTQVLRLDPTLPHLYIHTSLKITLLNQRQEGLRQIIWALSVGQTEVYHNFRRISSPFPRPLCWRIEPEPQPCDALRPRLPGFDSYIIFTGKPAI